MNGFLNLLKPPGMTSSDAVVFIRRTLSGEKVGHAGTLDPEAAGVLPIMIGKAARLFDWVADKQKEYIAEIAFGSSTDTQDAQGAVIERSNAYPTELALRAALPHFVGDILQVPPAYSALKISGKPAYALARQGEEVSLCARPARVDALELIEMMGECGALLRIVCGRGVYIRTLCHDLGAALSCPAHMRFLLRTRAGPFDIAQSVTLDEWQQAPDQAALLTPLDVPIAHLPMARVDVRFAPQIASGMAMTNFESIDADARTGDAVRVYCGDQFAGLARWKDSALRFHAMLMDATQ